MLRSSDSSADLFRCFLFWLLIPHLIWVCAGAGWWWIDDWLVRSFGSRGGICIVQGHPRMSTPARKRLMRDFKRLMQDPPAGISGAPQDNNILLWNAVIFGPDDTPWDGGTFKLTLQFTEEYPNKPPTVRFVSRMFHPNIYADGSICLDILQNQWSPIYDVAAILTSIQSLLCDPNPNSPANSEAARMFSENKREYNRKVREVVEQSWTAD
ncbi:hypothetical protein PVAP13_5KG059287 [Panicum virgatum]|uniref:E2 ubiquitin-conjugating enzyme n=1 Tax=Panicum virgatum TaxID=38727 RepID=A0A8T0SCM4_PANVG|nr:hypothetical protein PVAP13_5KG059287 [Panicum virgatum]